MKRRVGSGSNIDQSILSITDLPQQIELAIDQSSTTIQFTVNFEEEGIDDSTTDNNITEDIETEESSSENDNLAEESSSELETDVDTGDIDNEIIDEGTSSGEVYDAAVIEKDILNIKTKLTTSIDRDIFNVTNINVENIDGRSYVCTITLQKSNMVNVGDEININISHPQLNSTIVTTIVIIAADVIVTYSIDGSAITNTLRAKSDVIDIPYNYTTNSSLDESTILNGFKKRIVFNDAIGLTVKSNTENSVNAEYPKLLQIIVDSFMWPIEDGTKVIDIPTKLKAIYNEEGEVIDLVRIEGQSNKLPIQSHNMQYIQESLSGNVNDIPLDVLYVEDTNILTQYRCDRILESELLNETANGCDYSINMSVVNSNGQKKSLLEYNHDYYNSLSTIGTDSINQYFNIGLEPNNISGAIVHMMFKVSKDKIPEGVYDVTVTSTMTTEPVVISYTIDRSVVTIKSPNSIGKISGPGSLSKLKFNVTSTNTSIDSRTLAEQCVFEFDDGVGDYFEVSSISESGDAAYPWEVIISVKDGLEFTDVIPANDYHYVKISHPRATSKAAARFLYGGIALS